MAREKAARVCTYMISRDMQPLSVVEDVGFCRLAQTFIDIGTQYGCLPIDEVLVDRTTPSKFTLPKLYDECVEKFKSDLHGVARVAKTTDHWTDDLVKKCVSGFYCTLR